MRSRVHDRLRGVLAAEHDEQIAHHRRLQKWAADELRSVNAQIEWALRRALQDAGRATARRGESAPRRRYGRERLGAKSRSG